MSNTDKAVGPDDFAKLTELHDMAAHACELLKAMANEWRLMILCHLAEGQSNKAIARELGISDGTVKLHVKAILRKLAVHSRVEAAVIAVEKEFCTRGSR